MDSYRVGYITKHGDIEHQDFLGKDDAYNFLLSIIDNLKCYRVLNVSTHQVIDSGNVN